LAASASLIYLGAAVWCFYEFRRIVELLKYYGVSEEAQLELDNVMRWRFSLTLAGYTFLAFGVASLIAGYGLSRRKRWGLYLWGCLVGCFLIFHVSRAIMSYRDGGLVLVERGFEILAVLIVAVITKVLVSTKHTPFHGTPPPPPENWGEPPRSHT
jgi:uncharacterized membrane protein (DUF2068 family)